jgi:hypothetical protein
MDGGMEYGSKMDELFKKLRQQDEQKAQSTEEKEENE